MKTTLRASWTSMIALALAASVGGCPAGDGSDDSGEPDAQVGQPRPLEGVWENADGLVIAFQGGAARLVSFGGRVTGRQFFDVGDDYLVDIDSATNGTFVARLAQFETADSRTDDILHILGFSRADAVIAVESDYAFELTSGGRRQRFTSSYHSATAYEYGGACEILGAGGPGAGFACDDSGTKAMCESTLRLGRFWENTTCRQLGYDEQYAPAMFRAVSDFSKGGARGFYGDRSGGSGAGWADGSGGGPLQNGQLPSPSTDGGIDGGTEPEPNPDGGITDPDGGVTPSDAGQDDLPTYLVYGDVWGAPSDCPEGSGTFDDAIAYYWQVVEGEWSDTYNAARDQMIAKIEADHPEARSHYIQSSWFTYGPEASHAVIIEYTKYLAAWDCRPRVVAIGYGTSYESALQSALDKKANNDSAAMPYDELEHVTW